MPRCDDEALGRLIYLTAQDMRNFAERILSPFELTIEQFHLLKNLSCEEGMTQRQIGLQVNKTPANMTRILDRMEAKSLIHRQNDPVDRRAMQVFLTEAGLAIIERVIGVFESFSEDLARGISVPEQEILRKSLKTIQSNLVTMQDCLDMKAKEGQ